MCPLLCVRGLEDNFVESVLFFYLFLGSKDWTQVIRYLGNTFTYSCPVLDWLLRDFVFCSLYFQKAWKSGLREVIAVSSEVAAFVRSGPRKTCSVVLLAQGICSSSELQQERCWWAVGRNILPAQLGAGALLWEVFGGTLAWSITEWLGLGNTKQGRHCLESSGRFWE